MEFKSEFETYKFIMDLETYIMESTPVPFTNKVMVDKDIMYDYLDRFRTKLPKELKECKKEQEKDEDSRGKLVSRDFVEENNGLKDGTNSQEKRRGQAQRLIQEAKEAKKESLREREKIGEAEIESARIIAKAKEEAQRLILEAEEIKKESLREREKIGEAEKESARIIAKAKEEAQGLIWEAEKIKKETLKGREKIGDAEKEALAIINGAREYADQFLSDVEVLYKDNLREIIKGRREIENILVKISRRKSEDEYKIKGIPL